MAARGSITKQKITEKILATFPGSFTYNDGKEIRINETEDGAPIQIKVTLTAAKVAVGQVENAFDASGEEKVAPPADFIPEEPSEEEKEHLKTLLEKLGL